MVKHCLFIFEKQSDFFANNFNSFNKSCSDKMAKSLAKIREENIENVSNNKLTQHVEFLNENLAKLLAVGEYMEVIEHSSGTLILNELSHEIKRQILAFLDSNFKQISCKYFNNEPDSNECLLRTLIVLKDDFYSLQGTEKFKNCKTEIDKFREWLLMLDDQKHEYSGKMSKFSEIMRIIQFNQRILNQINRILIFSSQIKKRHCHSNEKMLKSLKEMEEWMVSQSKNENKLFLESESSLEAFLQKLVFLFRDVEIEFSEFENQKTESQKLTKFLSSLSLNELLKNINRISSFYKQIKFEKIRSEFKCSIKTFLAKSFEQMLSDLQNSNNFYEIELKPDFKNSKFEINGNFTHLFCNELEEKYDFLKKCLVISELDLGSEFESKIELTLNTCTSLIKTHLETHMKIINKKSNPLILWMSKLNSCRKFIDNFRTHSGTSESLNDYHFLIENLKILKELRENISDFSDSLTIEQVTVQMKNARELMNEENCRLIDEILSAITIKVNKDWASILSFVKIEKSILIDESIRDNIDDLESNESFESFNILESKMHKSELMIHEIQKINEFTDLYFDSKQSSNENLNLKKFNDFKFLFQRKKNLISEKSKNIQKNFAVKFSEISKSFEDIFMRICELKKLKFENYFDDCHMNVLSEQYFSWSDFSEQNKSILFHLGEYKDLFSETYEKFQKIKIFFGEEIGEIKHYLKLQKYINEFSSRFWIQARLDLPSFREGLKFYECSSDLKTELVRLKISKVLENWHSNNQSLSLITGEDFSHRSWTSLKQLLEVETSFERITVFELIKSPKFPFLKSAFEELKMTAKNEKLVCNLLDDMIYFTHAVEFKMKSYVFNTSPEVFHIFNHLERLDDQMNEKVSILVSLTGNPFAEIFNEKIDLVTAKIKNMNECLQLIKATQQKWISLFSIMTSDFVKNGKKNEYLKFILVHQKWVELLGKSKENPKVHYLFENEDRIEFLSQLISSLDSIQKNLFEFLELKRIEFPRFYFLGDYDLIDFLGNHKRESSINSVISKFIPACHRVIIDSANNNITGLISHLNEEFELCNPIDLRKGDRNWLDFFIEEIKHSILNKFFRNYKSSRFEIESFPNASEQIVMIIFWMKFIEELQNTEILKTIDKTKGKEIGNKNHSLNELKKAIQRNVQKLISWKFEKKFMNNLKKSLILDSIYQMEIVDRFLKDKDTSDSYLFFSLLKYWCECMSGEEMSVKNTRLFGTIGSYKTQYSSEYLGNQPKLVQTPLTEKCFLAMSTSLAIGLGGNPYGPAGTGKTESIKALGGVLGRLVIVFNCDETMNYRNMSRLFIGIVGTGAWGCFDEFNRLNSAELSAISHVISQIQLAQKSKNQTKVEIHGTKIHVSESVGIFITLNPLCEGYKGRHKLPKNLTVLFRSFSMSVPNSEMIVRISLICIGFDIDFAQTLSKCLVDLFESTSKLLDTEKSYDWGLRGLKSLISQIEFYTAFLSKNQEICGNLKLMQFKSIKLAIQTNIVSKLHEKDKRIFEEILSQKLKRISGEFNGQSDGQSSIETKTKLVEIFKELNLLPLDSQVDLCCQILNILNQKTGFGITGKPSTGKSTLFEALKTYCMKECSQRVKIYKLCPKSMEKRDLFGCYHGEENEFREGVFVKILREALRDLSEENYESIWVIFDGPIDPNWAENLNSALDDNQLFTLVNGERLIIPNNLKLIFETENFDHASMATISRLNLCNLILSQKDTDLLIDFNISRTKSAKESEISEIQELFENTNLDRLILSKRHLNSKLIMSRESFFSEKYLSIQSMYFCNRRSTVSDFMKFIDRVVQSNKSQNFEIFVNDLDIVELDEFGCRPLEELLIQIIDFGWVFYNNKYHFFDKIVVFLNQTEEIKLAKFSKRFLGRLKINGLKRDGCDETIDQENCIKKGKLGTQPERENINSLKEERGMNRKMGSKKLEVDKQDVYHLYKTNFEKINNSKSLSYELLMSLCENIESIGKEKYTALKRMTDGFLKTERFQFSPFISNNFEKISRNFKNNRFFTNRMIKLATCLTSDVFEKLLFVYCSETLADFSVQLVAAELDFEIQPICKTADFKKQIFEIISSILNGRKILLTFHDLSPKDEQTIFHLDVLCNYPDFSYFVEEYKTMSGKSSEENIGKKLSQLKSNFKILVFWNKNKTHDFENLLNGYSCFSRHFVSVIDESFNGNHLSECLKHTLQNTEFEKEKFVGKFIVDKTTPEKLLKQTEIFEKILRIKSASISERDSKLTTGLDKLNQTENQVDNLKQKIIQEKLVLSGQQNQLDQQIVQLSVSSAEINNQKLISEKLTEKLQTEKASLTLKKESINLQLEAVIPIVEEAKSKIKSLSKSNIDELRNYHIPPEVVLDIFGVLLKLMNETDVSWNNMKKILGKRTVIEQIVEVDPRKVSNLILREVEGLIEKKPDSFIKEKVAKISMAAAPIAEFVKAIIKFVRTVQNIKPLEEEYLLLNENLKISESKLIETEKNVEKIVVQQNSLKKQMLEKSLEIEKFKQQIKAKEELLEKSTFLLTNLGSEKSRWKDQLDQLTEQKKSMSLSALAVSHYLVYMTHEKSNLAKIKIKEFKKDIGIAHKCSLSGFLMSSQELNYLSSFAHPKTKHDHLNTYKLLNFEYSCALYDPDNKILEFVKRCFSVSECFDESNERLNLKLELSIKLGKPIIVRSRKIPKNEFILDCLSQNAYIDRNSLKMKFGDKMIDFNKKSKVFLIFQEFPNPAEILNKFDILNYSISRTTIQNEILSNVINWKKQNLEKTKIKLFENKLEIETEIFISEENLLKILSESSSNVLEDNSLFKTLNELKISSESNSKTLKELEENLKNLENERNFFSAISRTIGLLFDCTISLKNISVKFAFSSEFLMRNFDDFIKGYQKEFEQGVFMSDYFQHLICEIFLCLDQETKSSFLLTLLDATSSFDDQLHGSLFLADKEMKSSYNSDLFNLIFKDDRVKNENGHKQEQTVSLKLKNINFQSVQKNDAISRTQNNNKASESNSKNEVSILEKLFYAKENSSINFLDLTNEYLKQKFPKVLFDEHVGIYEWIRKSCSQINILYQSNEKSTFEFSLSDFSESTNSVEILIGTVSVNFLMKQLTASSEKESLLILKNIHSNFESCSAILSFVESHLQKFHPKFKLVLTTSTPEHLPLKLIEISSKYSLDRQTDFNLNLRNAKKILQKNHDLLNLKTDSLCLFHSSVLERMKFIPLGWSTDYEFSNSELHCINDLSDSLQQTHHSDIFKEIVLKILYFAKIDNKNDKKVMKILHKKAFESKSVESGESKERKTGNDRKSIKKYEGESSEAKIMKKDNNDSKINRNDGNEPNDDYVGNESTDFRFLSALIGLQNNSVQYMKAQKMKTILKNIGKMSGNTSESSKERMNNQKIKSFEIFNEFWLENQKAFQEVSEYRSSNSLIESYIDSELNLFKTIVHKLAQLNSSLVDFMNSKIKLTEILYYNELINEETPNELQKIWQNKTNFGDYLVKFLEMWNFMKINFDFLKNDKLVFNVKGLIGYRKLFEILKVLNEKKNKENKDHLVMLVDLDNSEFLLNGVRIQGGYFNEKWVLNMNEDHKEDSVNFAYDALPVRFMDLSDIDPDVHLKMQFFNNCERSRLVGELFVKIEKGLKESILLSSVAFYVHD